MDIINICLFCLMSVIIGAVLMLVIQYYAYVKFINLPENDERRKSLEEKYNLPENILASMNSPDQDRNSVNAINLITQFLFHELRHSISVRRTLHRKFSMELDDLCVKTTIGRFFDKLTVREIDFGHEFPEIKFMKVHTVDIHPDEGFIDNLDVILNIHYEGKFQVIIDADMVLAKKGSVSVLVQELSGLVRIRFTRSPYTHYSVCFLGDPHIKLSIESMFQGQKLQAHLSSLISVQIRKAIRRKHTLPNFRVRLKPFFNFPEEDFESNDIVLGGTLAVNLKAASRLAIPPHLTHVYCIVTLVPIPWVMAKQQDDQNLAVSIDISIHKSKNQQIGIIFKQTENYVSVETVMPNTPAAKAKLKANDTLISINGKKATNISQVAKIIKSITRPMFNMRVERIVPGLIKNDAVSEDFELSLGFNETITFSKQLEAVQIVQMARKSSEDLSSDSSHTNSPTQSPSKKLRDKIKRPSLGGLKQLQKKDSVGSQHSPATSTAAAVDGFPQHSFIDCEKGTYIHINDKATFQLQPSSQFININIFGRGPDDLQLLGYVNIPTQQLLGWCSESSIGKFENLFQISPPDTPNLSTHPLSAHKGFDAKSCFGQLLISFKWTSEQLVEALSLMQSVKKKKPTDMEKLELDVDTPTKPPADLREGTKQHKFVRTHFNRTTLCDYCVKKIWLKDAVQCQNCTLVCHKKCIAKCQKDTVCGPFDAVITSPELKISEAEVSEFIEDLDAEIYETASPKLDTHRQSFSELLVQGMKRVNSANNLAIPGLSSALGQGSRSLPPTPQHTPRKQSLINSGLNPFSHIVIVLESFPHTMEELTRELILELVEPLIGHGTPDELMGMAKTASKLLFENLQPLERVESINKLLGKLRLALDSETINHGNLQASLPSSATTAANSTDSLQAHSIDSTKQLRAHQSSSSVDKAVLQQELTKKLLLLGQSEERVQILSVIMLYLCSGLQHAQGIAGQG